MKIIIFTKDLMNPPHPRIEMEKDILEKEGYEVELVHANQSKPKKTIDRIYYYLSLTFFRWDLIRLYKKIEISEASTILLYDLSLLPLARYFKRKGKKVIYETIDDNAELISYHIQSKLPIFKWLITLFKKMIMKFETAYSKKYCDVFIINSDNLSYINPEKARTNYYASPFESVNITHSAALSPAFIYLGLISDEKGFDEMNKLSIEFKIPLYLFGNFATSKLEEKAKMNPFIHHTPRINSIELEKKITSLAKDTRLIGLSLIKNVHKSYALQEANKDIDYIAMGIPFIGNKRGSTKEKIEASCGVFINDIPAITKLLTDGEFYMNKSKSALQLYRHKYAINNFRRILLDAIQN